LYGAGLDALRNYVSIWIAEETMSKHFLMRAATQIAELVPLQIVAKEHCAETENQIFYLAVSRSDGKIRRN